MTAESVFAAAAKGDERAVSVVADEARLVARAIGAVVSIVDPDLIVVGGASGRSCRLPDAVEREVHDLAPVVPELRASAGRRRGRRRLPRRRRRTAWARITSAIIA